jgi:hypothetical protein
MIQHSKNSFFKIFDLGIWEGIWESGKEFGNRGNYFTKSNFLIPYMIKSNFYS